VGKKQSADYRLSEFRETAISIMEKDEEKSF